LATVLGTHVLASLLAALSLAGGHASPPEAIGRAVQPSGRAATASAAARPLAGKVVGIDPGHNGGNFSDPGFINHLVWNGREEEACDTTGTETDGGYTEALFNFNVASYLRAILIREGAKVVMTRRTNEGVGPCIDRRAQILDKARADVAIDIHADGGPPGGRGVAILTPVPDGPNDHVIAASKRFGRILLRRYTTVTGIPVSNYDGSGGFAPRDNLAGLNLTTVPKVLIECVNMRNAADAARLVKPSFQRLAAKSMAEAITGFLLSR
jgi:N-acetylmuramoyl-L-alanine amidase